MVSFLIPFPHCYIRLAPSGTATFNSEAELVPIDNDEVQSIFSKKRNTTHHKRNSDTGKRIFYVY